MPDSYCWHPSAGHTAHWLVSDPYVRLARPVATCRAHLPELLANIERTHKEAAVQRTQTLELHSIVTVIDA